MLSGRLSEKSQHPFQSNVSASSNGRCSRVRPLTTEDTGLLVRYRLEWDGRRRRLRLTRRKHVSPIGLRAHLIARRRSDEVAIVADLPTFPEGPVDGGCAQRHVGPRHCPIAFRLEKILLRRQHGGEVGGARLVLFCANLQRAPGRNGPAAQEVSWTRDCKKVEIPLSSSCCALSTPF